MFSPKYFCLGFGPTMMVAGVILTALGATILGLIYLCVGVVSTFVGVVAK